MSDTDTRAALDAAIDAYASAREHMERGGYDPADQSSCDAARANLDTAIAAHVEAEVAQRMAAAPEVEAAINDLRANAHSHAVGALTMDDVEECHRALLAAIAADKARAVAAARLTPDEARRLVDNAMQAAWCLNRPHGLAPDEREIARERAASARAALLRALGVEA